LIAVLPTEIKTHWPRIKSALEKLCKIRTDGWIPEDVYAFLIGGHATLYVNEGEWRGFVILQLLPNYSGKRLHIWIAHGVGEVVSYMEEIRQIAKHAGADRITFESSRKGWEKRASRFGFKSVRTIYEVML
jgi:hypothetical protein